ncbi:hypothetical protein [Lysinibacillus fusiformis]
MPVNSDNYGTISICLLLAAIFAVPSSIPSLLSAILTVLSAIPSFL